MNKTKPEPEPANPVETKLDLIILQQSQILEQQEEIIEKLTNLNLDGRDYSIDF